MYRIKKSNINGRGVFATANIASGTMVIEWSNTRELTSEEYKALSDEDLKYIDIQCDRVFLVGEPERFCNHSCDANTIYGIENGIGRDIASRDIKIGEEITSDYSKFCNPNRIFFCNCGSGTCRGKIE
jgi:SET domain-containing protein